MADPRIDNQFLRTGISHHNSGAVAAALTAYRSALAINPSNGAAGNLLGLAENQLGDDAAALRTFTRTFWCGPGNPDTLNHLAMTMAKTEATPEALQQFKRAVLITPGKAGISLNLARTAKSLGSPGLSFKSFSISAASNPGQFEAWIGLASLSTKLGRHASATEYLETAGQINGHHPLYFFEKARLEIQTDQRDIAAKSLQDCLKVSPLMAEAYNELANILRERDLDLSEIGFRKGLIVAPGMEELWAGYSATLFDCGTVDRAAAAAKIATGLNPGSTIAYNNAAKALTDVGRFDAAVDYTKKALIIAPEDTALNYSEALTALASGRLEDGWKRYFFRRPAQLPISTSKMLPRFDANPKSLRNGRYLILAEQGVGDEIMFASCFAELEALVIDKQIPGAVVECDERLLNLFSRSFPALSFVPRLKEGSLDDARQHYEALRADHGIEYTVLSGSLLKLFRRSLSKFPQHRGYLTPDQNLVEEMGSLLRGPRAAQKRIGISWRSMNAVGHRGSNYPPVEAFGPIFSLPSIEFVNLQYHQPEDGLETIRSKFGVDVTSLQNVDLMNDFDATAALMSRLDAVIAPQIATYCLAGAVGTRCHAVFRGHSWPSFGTDRLPFFPNSRLWVRGPEQTWHDLFDALTAGLKDEWT